jgi:NAD(P)H-flavin reductase
MLKNDIPTPLKPFQALIESIKKETSDVKTYVLSITDEQATANFKFKPGQFNMLSIRGLGESAVSISSLPSGNGEFTHTVRSVGRVTNKLATLEEGATLGIRGPYGRPWPIKTLAGKNVIIVAGGIGVAPLKPIILTILKNRGLYKNVEVLYGVKKAEDFLFKEEFDLWRKNGINISLTVDKGSVKKWPYHVGVVTTLFENLTSGHSNSIALMCGPDVMMQFSTLELLRSGFSTDQIYLSLERRMDCGIRMCGHCMLGPKFVCHDGPVFPYSDVKELFGYVA